MPEARTLNLGLPIYGTPTFGNFPTIVRLPREVVQRHLDFASVHKEICPVHPLLSIDIDRHSRVNITRHQRLGQQIAGIPSDIRANKTGYTRLMDYFFGVNDSPINSLVTG